MKKEEIEMLSQSNYIENELSDQALDDAVMAWKWAKKQPINLKTILGIHKRLLKNLNPTIAGKIRECDVYIGGRRCEFTSTEELIEDLKEWSKDANTSIQEPGKDGENIRLDHISFEHIHPFEDGNGRTGRILYNLQRIKAGLPIHIIYEEERYDYYKWFTEKERKKEVIDFLINNL